MEGDELLKASLNGDLTNVNLLLDGHCDPNFQGSFSGSTALHRAAARGHEAIVLALLAARASVSIVDANGGNPLNVARSRNSKCKVIAILETAHNVELEQGQGMQTDEPPVLCSNVLAPHLQLLIAAYGEDVGRTGHYTRGHQVLGDADIQEAVKSTSSLLYGELLPESASELFAAFGLSNLTDGIFLELGMGTGKVALQAFLENLQLIRVFGIELAPSRYAVGESALIRLADLMPSRFKISEISGGKQIVLQEYSPEADSWCRSIEFKCGDMLTVEAKELQKADAVCMGVCLPTSLHTAVCRRMWDLKPGAKLFCFADLVAIWPEELTDAVCPLQHCCGADSSAYNKRYRTTWAHCQDSEDDGHPFFLMEANHQIPWGQDLDPMHIQAQKASAMKDDLKARERAKRATNPSNSTCIADDAVLGFIEFAREMEKDDADRLTPGQMVEVANRYHHADREPAWSRAIILSIHADCQTADVVYSHDGGLEESCKLHRMRVVSH